MKNTKQTLMRRALSLTLAAGCALSLIEVPIQAAMPEKLENAASRFEITVPSEEYGKGKELLVDGDDNTLWVAGDGTWPAKINFHTPLDNPTIYKVVVRFEKGWPNRSMDVKLSHVVNSVMDAPVPDRTADDFAFDGVFEYAWPEGINATDLVLELSDPKTDGNAGQFWPGLAEVEIYTEQKAADDEEQLVNIAPEGQISSINPSEGNPAHLIDGDYSTLYVFSQGLSSTGGSAWTQVDFDQPKKISAVETAFENLGSSDPSQFRFTYDILGRSDAAGEWRVLAADQKATRLDGDCIKTSRFDAEQTVQAVRILIKSIESTGGDPWPALAELKIFAKEEISADIPEGTNIAEGKPIHTNTSQKTVSRITDGSLSTVWSGEMYPAYIDIDLEENYALDDAVVYTPESGYSQYSIYTSMDGVDFERVARKTSEAACTRDGETWDLAGKEARVVRLYMEYNSANASSQVREFVLHGTKTDSAVIETPEVSVEDFSDTDYVQPITNQETIEEVQGIIRRRLGADYVSWFTFELKDAASGYDYYDVETRDGKIHITGNNGVSLATGLNAYLENVINVHISQVGDQITMPDSIVLPEEKMHKETKFPVRYSYNYCTLSYSMAFWGEQEWRNELDWLALNGVNVVLDATGMEEVWRRFLTECGYSHQEIKDFIAGPAYYAWFYMANLSGMGGPIPDSWFAERTELARKNHRIMQRLGMQPVLQGYCGMVPVDFKEKQPNASIIEQGKWCNFQRPYMLKTDDPATFDKYADMFYKAQKDVFGDITDFYATDPFHEGGNTGGMNITTIARKTLDLMIKNDEDAVWIIQSWQGNPSRELLNGLEGRREHALVLDLYAEREPHWNSPSYGADEFGSTPWVYCMLNNFGGRLGLYGHLESLNKSIPAAANQASHMKGIGIAPEASQNNPLLYEFIFDTIWTEDASQPLEEIDLKQWTEDYARRRYGADSESAVKALEIMEETVYDGLEHERKGGNFIGQGAPENVVNSRPALSIGAASTWGWSSILYSKAELERALELLLEDYDTLSSSEAYMYDLVTLAQQVLSNYAQTLLAQMNAAASRKNLAEFTAWSDQFLDLIRTSNDLLSTRKIYTLGNWTQAASRLVSNPDDFTSDLFDLNAKALVSTWGSINQCNAGGLKDYSNRQWSGLTEDLYLRRWVLFIAEKKKELAGEDFRTFSGADWFALEWAWARDNETEYTEVPSDLDVQELTQKVLETFSVRVLDPEVSLDGILDPTKMSAAAGSASSSDPASNVLDDNMNTIWHTDWNGANGTDREKCWIELAFDQPAKVTSLVYKPRNGGGNGTIIKYRVELIDESKDGDSTWKTVSSGTWIESDSWKEAIFDRTWQATKVRLIAEESVNQEANTKNFASASEIRVKGTFDLSLDVTLIKAVSELSEGLNLDHFDQNQPGFKELANAFKEAEELFSGAVLQEEADACAMKINRALLELRKTPDASLLNSPGR